MQMHISYPYNFQTVRGDGQGMINGIIDYINLINGIWKIDYIKSINSMWKIEYVHSINRKFDLEYELDADPIDRNTAYDMVIYGLEHSLLRLLSILDEPTIHSDSSPKMTAAFLNHFKGRKALYERMYNLYSDYCHQTSDNP